MSNDNFNGSFVQMECKFVHGHTTLSTVPTPSLSPLQNSGLLPDFMSNCIHGHLTTRNILQSTLSMPPGLATASCSLTLHASNLRCRSTKSFIAAASFVGPANTGRADFFLTARLTIGAVTPIPVRSAAFRKEKFKSRTNVAAA